MSDTKEGIKLVEQTIRKMGNFHYISIPKAFIDNKILSMSKKYEVFLMEKEDEKQKILDNKQEGRIKT